ncbi:hypothetical protein RSAG8_07755, partial [Rhizoctonia solani AG-8 WAC10335]
MPAASWSTSPVNSTLSFQYWGIYFYLGWWYLSHSCHRGNIILDGKVEGNMSIQVLHGGMRVPWDLSGDTLFSWWSTSGDFLSSQNLTLRVLDASPDARLTVAGARVNGISFSGY